MELAARLRRLAQVPRMTEVIALLEDVQQKQPLNRAFPRDQESPVTETSETPRPEEPES
jgi:hypothetical protein